MSRETPSSPKRNIPKTIALSDEDIVALEKCISFDPIFPPTPAEMIVVLVRNSMARLLRGEDQLKDLYKKYGTSHVSIQEAIE